MAWTGQIAEDRSCEGLFEFSGLGESYVGAAVCRCKFIHIPHCCHFLQLEWHLKDWIGVTWHRTLGELPGAEREFGNSDEWREKIKQMRRMGFIYLHVLAVQCT